MRLPLLEHSGLYITREFLSRNPPEPVRLEKPEFSGSGPEPDYERLGAALKRIMESFTEPSDSDGQAAAAIHENLPMSRREASDMRFWHYLAAVKYPHYVGWRYFDSRAGKTNKSRFAGLLDDNAFSRLWWFADLTLDPASADRYWRAKRTAISLEFVRGIVQNLFGGNRPLVSSLASVLFNGNGKPPDSLVQRVFTSANVLLVSVDIDALSETEIARIVQRLYSSAKE